MWTYDEVESLFEQLAKWKYKFPSPFRDPNPYGIGFLQQGLK